MKKNPKKGWRDYYKEQKTPVPRKTLLIALDKIGKRHQPMYGVDLGCGSGQDTHKLLSDGWTVMAIDSSPIAFEYLLKKIPIALQERLLYQCRPFENAYWEEADLVNASYSLPFCPPNQFAKLWKHIVFSLKKGGYFAGQFFGDRDDWKNLNLLSEKEIKKLFKGFEIVFWEEEEKDSRTATSKDLKHWHVFHIVARKK